jgi:hypothetical protein
MDFLVFFLIFLAVMWLIAELFSGGTTTYYRVDHYHHRRLNRRGTRGSGRNIRH